MNDLSNLRLKKPEAPEIPFAEPPVCFFLCIICVIGIYWLCLLIYDIASIPFSLLTLFLIGKLFFALLGAYFLAKLGVYSLGEIKKGLALMKAHMPRGLYVVALLLTFIIPLGTIGIFWGVYLVIMTEK